METSMIKKVAQYIQQLSLLPHPEGGHYASVYRSSEVISAASLPARFQVTGSFQLQFISSLRETSIRHFTGLRVMKYGIFMMVSP